LIVGIFIIIYVVVFDISWQWRWNGEDGLCEKEYSF